jgi:hypothetical protein
MDAAWPTVGGPRLVSLSSSPTLFIVDAVDETTLKTADPRLSLELRAQGWWVKGL